MPDVQAAAGVSAEADAEIFDVRVFIGMLACVRVRACVHWHACKRACIHTCTHPFASSQVFDTEEKHIGTELRAVCHRDGLWHRAVYALLFNSQVHVFACLLYAHCSLASKSTHNTLAHTTHPQNKLLIQRRSAQKKVCPGLWDLSTGDHELSLSLSV